MHGPKVLFLTSGPNVPSTRYRILPYLPRLRSLGFHCDVAHSFPEKYQKIPYLGWRASHLLRGVFRRIDLIQAKRNRYDAILLEREIFDDPSWHVEAAFRKLTDRFILDVDDAIFLRYPEKFARIAEMSDIILAGNPNLAKVCRSYNDNVVIVPTAIDLDDYRFDQPRDPNPVPVIGWIGTPGNVPYLNVCLPALQQLATRHRYQLRIITSDEAALAKLPLNGIDVDFRKWNPQTATQEIRQFDIGIMPLPDEEWERYKCGFKLLQYMACSLPAVASPVGVNQQIITHRTDGLLASNSEEWFQALDFLLTHPAMVSSIGFEAHNKIAENYSTERQLPQLVRALTR